MRADPRGAACGRLVGQGLTDGSYRVAGTPALVPHRGDGAYILDADGRRYLDATSGMLCCHLGYGYSDVVAAAAARQVEQLGGATGWGTAHPTAIELAEELAARAPAELDTVLLTGDGASAIEAAWRIARRFHRAGGEHQRDKAITRRLARHGSSMGAMAFVRDGAGDGLLRPRIAAPQISNTRALRDVDHVDEGAFCRRLLDELEQTILAEGPDRVCAIIAEPIQIAGGCLVAPAGYWRGIRDVADRYGVLLIADETITGVGRLGEWFGSTVVGAEPDVVALGTGLAAGYAPIGAVLVAEHIAETLVERDRCADHDILFGGHPLSAAVALATMEVYDRAGVLENVRTHAPGFGRRLNALRDLPIVGDVRGEGFLWAIELVRGAGDAPFADDERHRLVHGFLPSRLLDEGLVARSDDPGYPVVQIGPPLTCGPTELDEIVDKLTAVLADAGQLLGGRCDR